MLHSFLATLSHMNYRLVTDKAQALSSLFIEGYPQASNYLWLGIEAAVQPIRKGPAAF